MTVLKPTICDVCGTPYYSIENPCAHVAALIREERRIEKRRITMAAIAVACFIAAGIIATVGIFVMVKHS